MSTELTEKVLSAINTGRTADMVYRHLREILIVQTTQVLDKMKSDFRSGKLDHITVQCRLAELCALEDVENKLRSQIVSGERAIRGTEQGD